MLSEQEEREILIGLAAIALVVIFARRPGSILSKHEQVERGMAPGKTAEDYGMLVPYIDSGEGLQ